MGELYLNLSSPIMNHLKILSALSLLLVLLALPQSEVSAQCPPPSLVEADITTPTFISPSRLQTLVIAGTPIAPAPYQMEIVDAGGSLFTFVAFSATLDESVPPGVSFPVTIRVRQKCGGVISPWSTAVSVSP